jgi:hypothetical protein
VTSKFTQRGFSIAAYNGDNEFEKLRDHLSPTTLNIVARGEHVGPIERSIRTIKERVRCSCQGLPYKRIPKIMTQSIVESSVTWLNAFPAKEGASKTLSPSAIILGTPKPDHSKLKITFGAYAQAYESTTNTTQARSIGAIALKPSNERGGYYFMSLSTGRRIHCYQWTELPIPDYIIDRVEALAEGERQPIMTNGHPIFEWSPGVPILDEDGAGGEGEDHDGDEVENDGQPYDYDTDEEEAEDNDESIVGDAGPFDNEDSEDDDEDEQNENQHDELDEIDNDTDQDEIDETTQNDEQPSENDDEAEAPEDTPSENSEQRSANINEENNVDPNLEPRSDGRPRRSSEATSRKSYVPRFGGKSYEAQFLSVARKEKQWSDECYKIAVDVMFTFTQMTADKGFKQFGERAFAAMFKEYNQLNDMAVFGKLNPDTLTSPEKKGALRAINLIKKKRNGDIKGRTCADGRPQRNYIPREEATSPTVSMEGLMASLVIDAHERRAVAIFDVPGAYLNADMPKDKFVLLKLEGKFVDIMCEVNPEYLEDVRTVNGKKVLYLRLLKALYGCIESALLWYELYVKVLKGMGFKINPYDRCIANKMINGKQCTIAWYVDDNKVSHVSEDVLTEVIDEVKKHFGELVVSRGKEHTFLGMNLKFKDDGTVHLGMKGYIEEAIELFGEDVSTKVANAATKKLFTVSETSAPLSTDKADLFHSVVAKLLWVMKRSRPDIETAISYLCTRVSCCNEDDWGKLKRLLQFLNQTIDDERIMGADDLFSLLTWIDASYGIHPNMRGHTGGAMSFGTGIIHGKASKQKLNTKSSTETEVVGTSDYLPYNIWLQHFMEHQGYKLKSNVLNQDNQSAIKMEKNGRNSCTGNSRHIHIRYFFVKDRVDKKELDIVYCPTEEMLADYFTKPLQGRLFTMFREVIMGWKHVNTLKRETSSPSKERVGNMDGSNDVRNPNAVRNPKPTYASVVAADAPAGSNANHRREMEKQDRMKKVSFLLFNPVR